MSRYFVIFSIVLLFLNQWGLAQTVTNLYQTTVAAEQGDEVTTHEPLKQALMQVLIKLSGNHKVMDNPDIKAKVEQADRLVLQYEYQTINGQSVLSVQFDEVAVKKLLRTAGLPIWGSQRPEWLMWIVLDTEGGQRQVIFNEEEQANDVNMIKTQAVQRGLPVLFPVLDIEDRTRLKISDITTGVRDPILATSKRYGAKAICTAWIFTAVETGKLESHWRLYIDDNEALSWKSSETDLTKLLNEATNKAIDSIAHYFLTTPDKKTSTPEPTVSEGNAPSVTVPKPTDETNTHFKLVITGVPGMRDYAQVQTYLQSLDVITQVQVLYMRPGQVTFAIESENGKAAVEQAISLGNVLTPETNAVNGEITYRFIK